MIKKLKIKVVILSTASLLILLFLLVCGINIINYRSTVKDADEILSLLSINQGAFPEETDRPITSTPPTKPSFEGGGRFPQHMSPELPYESRYFSVVFGQDSEITYSDVSKIASIDTQIAEQFAREAYSSEKSRGFIDEYRYYRYDENDTVRIIFLDLGRKLEAFYTFLSTSIILSVLGFMLVVFIISVLAGKIIHPIAESYVKQKRFITDAGHEIKTPLTIIRTNIDILEMELGENESLSDIKQQANRLSSLTEDLVYLARMEESAPLAQMIDFPLSEIVKESVDPYFTLLQAEQKSFTCTIQPDITFFGNDKAIRQLISILMDNATKYSDIGGCVSLTLQKQSRSILLTVTNSTDYPIDRQILSRVFDRFYRADLSRNSTIHGHGIGLSLAKAIVTQHNGKILADSQDPHLFQIQVSLPLS
ncbi:MAG: HAMP domain-containing histidine kinase [Clostridia bacterium]|nr:HAMP domain-containing histidine kinase [Clostridia bacterium]